MIPMHDHWTRKTRMSCFKCFGRIESGRQVDLQKRGVPPSSWTCTACEKADRKIEEINEGYDQLRAEAAKKPVQLVVRPLVMKVALDADNPTPEQLNALNRMIVHYRPYLEANIRAGQHLAPKNTVLPDPVKPLSIPKRTAWMKFWEWVGAKFVWSTLLAVPWIGPHDPSWSEFWWLYIYAAVVSYVAGRSRDR